MGMKGYKVLNPDWTCRDFKYEVGKIFEEDVIPKCCERGFHFCTELADCFRYYSFDPKNKVVEVEALGIVDFNTDNIDNGNTKCCTNKIYIIKELSWYEVLDLMNSGECNTGKSNRGHYNSGFSNEGNYNTGDNNEGSYNTGNHNIGYRNTGNFNIGHWNSGDWNLSNYSSGCFNTSDSTIFLFNKPSNWTILDWYNSEARDLLRAIGIVKNSSGKQKIWDRLSKESKNIVMNIPNFDADIFRKITGIDVKGKR